MASRPKVGGVLTKIFAFLLKRGGVADGDPCQGKGVRKNELCPWVPETLAPPLHGPPNFRSGVAPLQPIRIRKTHKVDPL